MKILILFVTAYLVMGLSAALFALMGAFLALFRIILWSTVGTFAITGAVAGALIVIAALLVR